MIVDIPPSTPTMDSRDRLVDLCENWTCYPSNLLRPSQLSSILERYRLWLTNDEKRLFDPAAENIALLELRDGDDGQPSN